MVAVVARDITLGTGDLHIALPGFCFEGSKESLEILPRFLLKSVQFCSPSLGCLVCHTVLQNVGLHFILSAEAGTKVGVEDSRDIFAKTFSEEGAAVTNTF